VRKDSSLESFILKTDVVKPKAIDKTVTRDVIIKCKSGIHANILLWEDGFNVLSEIEKKTLSI